MKLLVNLFNRWRVFGKEKPKKDGWYICTVEVPRMQRYVMDLYWYGKNQRFKDNRKQLVFSDYDVYAYNDVTHEYDKPINTDSLCDRTENVIAWKKSPKPYMKGFGEDKLCSKKLDDSRFKHSLL